MKIGIFHPTYKIKKVVCHSFVNAGRTQDTLGIEMEGKLFL